MIRQHLLSLRSLLAPVVVGLGSALACAAPGGGGHGGGAGHALGHGGFHHGPGGFHGGYGHPGCYHGRYCGYPGCYGYGFGLGLGLGYGLGYGYGYPYYPYYPYPYYPYMAGPPVYVSPGYAPAPAACAVATGGPAPAAPGATAAGGPLRLTDSDVILSVRVPSDAVVRINGEATTQNGPRRDFVSSGLSPGRTYTFVLSAHWTGPNGQQVELERRVQVQGGERRNVDFLAPSEPAPPGSEIQRAGG